MSLIWQTPTFCDETKFFLIIWQHVRDTDLADSILNSSVQKTSDQVQEYEIYLLYMPSQLCVQIPKFSYH